MWVVAVVLPCRAGLGSASPTAVPPGSPARATRIPGAGPARGIGVIRMEPVTVTAGAD